MNRLISILSLILFAGITTGLTVVKQTSPFSGRLPINDPYCLGAWYMNGSSTTETDRSGHSITIQETSATGGIPRGTDVPVGYIGYSRDFEASESEWLANTGSAPDPGGFNKLSFACWFKWESDSGAQTFISRTTSGQLQYNFRISSSNTFGGEIYVQPSAADIGIPFSSPTVIEIGVWHHLALIYDGDRRLATKFLDGKPVGDGTLDAGSLSTTRIVTSGSGFRIGAQGNNSNYADGRIDEAIIFKRALTNEEVYYLYAHGISGNKGGYD